MENGHNEEQGSGTTRLNFVASYPKSGNTWIRLSCAAYALGQGSDLSHFVELDDISPFAFQAVSPIEISKLGPDAQAQLRPAAMLVIAWQLKGPTLIKSHHASVEINGMPLWSPQWCSKVINPVRDPRDVCCSLADHMGMTYEQSAEFMRNSDATIGGDEKCHHILGSWSDHVGSWLRQDAVPVHTVRYEDMQEDTSQAIRNILEFLEIQSIKPSRVEAAVEYTRFDRMQELETQNGFPEKSDHQERFFRKGQSGGWEDELPADLARQIEDDHGAVMEQLGYL